jgi:glutamyl-tRNA reductase
MVIGLNHRTAPVAVQERYWISEGRRFEALAPLGPAEGVEEVVVLATCNRTEFLLWASDPSLAANSVLRFLSAELWPEALRMETFLPTAGMKPPCSTFFR